MPISKKTLALISFLAFLVGALVFWKFLVQKPKETLPVLPTPTPTSAFVPTIIPTSSKEKVINLLPLITENYTIQYLPVPQKFLVLILKNPFEKYKLEVEEWFRSQGIDPNDQSISWGSVRGVAPKTP